jgi:hypothetical protein
VLRLTIYLGVPTDPENVTNKAYRDALSYFKDLIVQMLQFSRAIAACVTSSAEIPQIPALICCKRQNLLKAEPRAASRLPILREVTRKRRIAGFVRNAFKNFHKAWRWSSES